MDANVQLGFGVDERDYGIGASIISANGHQAHAADDQPAQKGRAGLRRPRLRIDEIVPVVIAPTSTTCAT